MNITPIYELRTQLRNAAIAGTSLLPEDFRLKKAAENFQAISSASPVFAKIDKQIKALLNDNSPQNLLETLTLVDAVITALAAVGTKDDIQPITEISENRSAVVNAPYSQLSEITNALTLSGSGKYSTVKNAWENTPDIFNDYRVRPALVSALGASYSETAELAAQILTSMGKDVIPVLKNGFDPKGKKEMVRRIEIIEKICGGEENEFYLEQLKSAKKDVRNALILALGHDEANIEILKELVKTEKVNGRKAALSVLAKFDNKKSADFFEEYSEKSAVEAIEALVGVSAEWTCSLTARLIRKLLVDENGNTLTVSQTKYPDKYKLKEKTDFETLRGALTFKYGQEIENIYRECSGPEAANLISYTLGLSIAATDDEGLKKLALSLNSDPEVKGKYIYAETAARFFGSGDFCGWLKKRLAKFPEDETMFCTCSSFFGDISFENGGYIFSNRKYSYLTDKNIFMTRPVDKQIIEKIIDILIKYDYTARKLRSWIDPDDPVCCEKLGNCFCGLFKKDPNIAWLNLMGKCGIKNVKGLACIYFRHNNNNIYSIQSFFNALPGDREYKQSEINDLIENMRKGKIDSQRWSVNDLARWAEHALDK